MLGIRFHAPGTYRSVDVWDASTNDDDEVLSPAVTSTESNADTADILERQAFILKLCKNMVRTGVQTHRIEGAMAITGRRLDIRGTYVVLPGLLLAHFRNQTHLVHCSRALDMHKLAQVNAVAHEVEHGVLALSEASCCLDTLAGSPPTWNVWLTLVGYAMTSATTSPPFFKGSWTDCWVSGLFGLGVGVFTLVSEKIPMLGHVFEMVMTIFITFIALSLRHYSCYSVVALSAIVASLPGYTLTAAVMELAANKLCSGAVHLVHAIMYVLFLGFGMGYGSTVWHLAYLDTTTEIHTVCQRPVNPFWYFLLLPLVCLGSCLCFGANLRFHYPIYTLNAAVGFVAMYFLGKTIDSTPAASSATSSMFITPSVGAFALGIPGNLYARLTQRAEFVPLFGGVVILVPGSLGVRGAVSLFEIDDSQENGKFTFQMIGIALSITLGLFLANVCVYPTGKRQSVFLGF